MISDITYEQITGDYWYANYLGFKVIMMKSSGFVNATKLCLSGGKRFDNWTRLQGSKELTKFLDVKILEEKMFYCFVLINFCYWKKLVIVAYS